MLPLLLYAFGILFLIGAVIAALSGVFFMLGLQLLIAGVLLVVGLWVERWRYKPLLREDPQPQWKDTGERFVDPETGALTAVYFDAAQGERHYIVEDERSS